jgi:hypothetical protein
MVMSRARDEMPDQPTTNCFFSSVVTFLSGGFFGALLGALLNHFLSSARDRRARKYVREDAKEARKRDFISFMDKWRTEVERDNPHKTANEFSAKCALFRQEATKIRDDYDVQFWILANSLSSLRDSDVEEMSPDRTEMVGRERLLTAIDAIVNFVKAN